MPPSACGPPRDAIVIMFSFTRSPAPIREEPTQRSAQTRRLTTKTLLTLASLGVLGAWWGSDAALRHSARLDPLVAYGLNLAYGAEEGEVQSGPLANTVDLELNRMAPSFEVSPQFLSVAIDISQVAGGRWWSPEGRVEVGRGSKQVEPFDFTRPQLRHLAKALAPAYLRVGGTESDHVYYSVESAQVQAPPEGYELSLGRERWNALADFSKDAGFDLIFTVNAGPGPRGSDQEWRPNNAETLVRYARERGDEVAVWELGNEVNGYWFIHGMKHQPDGAQYARDLTAFNTMVKRHYPESKVAGPGSVFFPVVGPPMDWKFGVLEEFLRDGGAAADVITWHYYPQQSRRCPIATRRASTERLLEPAHLDEVRRWSAHVRQLRDRHAPNAEVWLGETGHAQCGGEPELSDRYVAGLWWLDQLGSQAKDGQNVVVRQTLVGADYGMLNRETLEPNPDYFNSLLWKQLMGSRVLDLKVRGNNPHLRAYAHCRKDSADGASLLLINTHQSQSVSVGLPDHAAAVVEYALSAATLTSRELLLNGEPLRSSGGALPSLQGESRTLTDGRLDLPPLQYSFVEIEDLNVPACANGA